MNVALTYDLKQNWVNRPGEPVDANAEFDNPATIDMMAGALESGGHSVERIGNVQRLMERLPALDADIVFNICEGVKGRNRESQVPVLLEMHGIPFVGADALTLGLTLDKVTAKKMFIADGIPTPRFISVRPGETPEKISGLQFPLIVKTRFEGTSKGICGESLVRDLPALQKRVRIIHDQYQQPALVEEFISGTEFTVAVLGNEDPQAMPVIQVSMQGNVNLGDQFFTFNMVTDDALQYVCPAQIPESLTHRMQELAVGAYQSVECRDFGRVDFRVDKEGRPYVLEINPLPSLASNDVFNIFPQTVGSSYEEVINRILGFALERYGLAEPKGDAVKPIMTKVKT